MVQYLSNKHFVQVDDPYRIMVVTVGTNTQFPISIIAPTIELYKYNEE